MNCKCLSMHSFSSEEDLRETRHIALHVLGQFKKKNCTEKKMIFFILFILFYIGIYWFHCDVA